MKIDQIKSLYPNPVGANAPHQNNAAYCVGGAICQFARTQGLIEDIDPYLFYARFPDNEYLAEKLMILNPNLVQEVALDFAVSITQSNDDGNFDLSWQHAEAALAYPGESK